MITADGIISANRIIVVKYLSESIVVSVLIRGGAKDAWKTQVCLTGYKKIEIPNLVRNLMAKYRVGVDNLYEEVEGKFIPNSRIITV